MARSLRSNAFSKLDFPTLGRPRITTTALPPDATVLPGLNQAAKFEVVWSKARSSSSFRTNAISSSPKSRRGFDVGQGDHHSERICSTSRDNMPRRCAWATGQTARSLGANGTKHGLGLGKIELAVELRVW